MSASASRIVECTFERRPRRKVDSCAAVVGVVASSTLGLSRIRRVLDAVLEREVRAVVIVSVAWDREGEGSVERPFGSCGVDGWVVEDIDALGTAAVGVRVGAGPRCGRTAGPLVGAGCRVLDCSTVDLVLPAPVSLASTSLNSPLRPSTKANLPSLANRARSSPAPRLASLRQYSQSRIHDTSNTLITPSVAPLPDVFISASSPSLSAELMNLETSQYGVASRTPVSRSSDASGGRRMTD